MANGVQYKINKQLESQLRKFAKGGYVKVGVVGPKASEVKEEHDGLTNAQIATFHEFGTRGGVPERSFLRSTAREIRGEMRTLSNSLWFRVLTNKMDMFTALSVLGMAVVTKTQEKIITHIAPELPLKTKRAKFKVGNSPKDTPLIMSGELLKSITHQVVE